MGKLENGLLRGVRGAVGPVVVSKSKGFSVVKIKAEKTSIPLTQPQIDQHNKFKMASKFVTQNETVYQIGYQYYKNRLIKPMNAGLSQALLTSFKGVSPSFTLDFANLKVSKDNGGLKEEHTASVVALAGQNVSVTWTSNDEYTELELVNRNLDRAIIMLYDETIGSSFLSIRDVTRAAGVKPIHVARAFVGGKVHVYFFFESVDGKVSNTQYLGTITVLA